MRRLVLLMFVGAIVAADAQSAYASDASRHAPAKHAHRAPLRSASLLDPFAWAVTNRSTGPYYVLVTIVNGATGKSRKVCINAPFLVGAMSTEMGLAFSEKSTRLVELAIIANKSRVYHFRNPRALANVEPRYTEAELIAARERVAPYTNAQLCGEPHQRTSIDLNALGAARDAVAHIVMERGLIVRLSDMPGGIYIMSAKGVENEQRFSAAVLRRRQEETAQAYVFARNIPGYRNLIKLFSIENPDIGGELSFSHSFSCGLTRRGPAFVDCASWEDPIAQNHPMHSWNIFLRKYRRASQIAVRQSWLYRWKKRYHGSIRFVGCGDANLLGRDEMTATMKAWRRGGLAGSPRYRYSLNMAGNGDGDLYLRSHGRKGLLYNPDDPEADCVKIDPTYQGPARIVPKSHAEQKRLRVYFRPVPPEMKGYQEYYIVEPLSGH